MLLMARPYAKSSLQFFQTSSIVQSFQKQDLAVGTIENKIRLQRTQSVKSQRQRMERHNLRLRAEMSIYQKTNHVDVLF